MSYTKGELGGWRNQGGTIMTDSHNNRKVIARVENNKAFTVEKVIANAQLIASSPLLHEELIEADRVICELCKQLNPQHATADYGKGCEWCQDRDSRLKALAKADSKISYEVPKAIPIP